MAQRREEVTTSLVYGTESFECKWDKRLLLAISEYFSSFSVAAAASAAEPAQEDVRLKYDAATVSVNVTSHVAQRSSCHSMSVRPSSRFPSVLPCGSLMAGNPAFDNERHIRSFMT